MRKHIVVALTGPRLAWPEVAAQVAAQNLEMTSAPPAERAAAPSRGQHGPGRTALRRAGGAMLRPWASRRSRAGSTRTFVVYFEYDARHPRGSDSHPRPEPTRSAIERRSARPSSPPRLPRQGPTSLAGADPARSASRSPDPHFKIGPAVAVASYCLSHDLQSRLPGPRPPARCAGPGSQARPRPCTSREPPRRAPARCSSFTRDAATAARLEEELGFFAPRDLPVLAFPGLRDAALRPVLAAPGHHFAAAAHAGAPAVAGSAASCIV